MLDELMMTAASYAPPSVKRWARAAGLGGAHPQHPRLRGMGVVTDLHFWVCDETVDTVLPLQNWYSALFPTVETPTQGMLQILTAHGQVLATETITLPPHALVTRRLSAMVGTLRPPVAQFGTIRWCLAMPPAVRTLLADQQPFYFWDRFAVGYQGRSGPPSFVHGVDKTWVEPVGRPPFPWYPAYGKTRTWTPEIPITVTRPQSVALLFINRIRQTATITCQADSHTTVVTVAPVGAQRVWLPVGGFVRVTVSGLPTTWGRPILMYHRADGSVDALHT